MPSILDPLTCGFAKVRCYCIFTCNNSIKYVDGATLMARSTEAQKGHRRLLI